MIGMILIDYNTLIDKMNNINYDIISEKNLI
jgi:hypothetical protein